MNTEIASMVNEGKKILEHSTKIKIRFNEVDSMSVVWHGHYVKYFEDGREGFGKMHDLGYMDIFGAGYTAPIVELNCKYKAPLQYGDVAIVKTTYHLNPAAKIIFEYSIYREADDLLVASGSSTQVFLDLQNRLVLNNPEFYQEWKAKKGLC